MVPDGPFLAALVAAATATTGHPSWVDVGTFAVAASMVLSGAVGVVLARNAVHSALMLVMTLFGVAVLFVLQQQPFIAVVQVIVYAGAIVVLFLFVIMFLGVDREEDITREPLRGQRPLAIALVLLGTTALLLLGQVSSWATGQPHVAGPSSVNGQSNVALLGKSIFTTYLFPFEATAALLVIAVIGAVVLARRPPPGTRSGGRERTPLSAERGGDPGGDGVPERASVPASGPAQSADPDGPPAEAGR